MENLRDRALTGPSTQRPPRPSPLRAACALAMTLALSGSLTLLNKSIYSRFRYPYPFHVLALHFAAISVCSRAVARIVRPSELCAYRERVTWPLWVRHVLTVGSAYGLAIVLSNLALKAFTPVLLVLITAILDARLPPVRTLALVLTISCGVAIAAYGEIHFVFIGVVYQLLGSLAEVSRLIATQRLLKDLGVDPVVALSALSPICLVMALVLLTMFEGFEPIFLLVPKLGVPLILLSIVLALSLNLVVLFLVSSTNALVLTLLGVVKDICLILGSVFFFNSKITSLQVFGYTLTTVGLVCFKFSNPPQSHLSLQGSHAAGGGNGASKYDTAVEEQLLGGEEYKHESLALEYLDEEPNKPLNS